MKRTLYSIIVVLFFAFSFSSNPPGWYVQQLPVNDFVNDIFFLDSLNGWLVTQGDNNPVDTSYIMSTTNGGDNWIIRMRQPQNLNVIQFLDMNTGYAGGGTGGGFARIYKSTNGGANWQLVPSTGMSMINDLYFVNKDTGWVCDPSVIFGGLYKTTNGSVSWTQQLDVSYKIQKIFFLNKDTSWAGNTTGVLYKTIDGGINWQQIFDFPDIFGVLGMEFVNSDTGWLTTTAIFKATTGGTNWMQYGGSEVGAEYSFISSNTGWASSDNNRVVKTTNSGINWFYQTIPIENALSICAVDSLKAWAGGNGIVHTTNGGLTAIESNTEILSNFILYQNFPNPFNPKTIINYELRITNYVSLVVYDILGNEAATLVSEKQNPGSYSVEFNGANLPSGIYFYKLTTGNFTQTKKMILTK